MAKYLLLESRDPFEWNDVAWNYELATNLAKAGNDVTLLLIQNGVLPARRGAQAQGLDAVLSAGVKVLADDFSLSVRGIGAERLTPGIAATTVDFIVDELAAGTKTLWH